MKPGSRPAGAGATIRSKCSTSQSRCRAWIGVRPLSTRASTGTPARSDGVLDRLEQRHRDRDLLLHRSVRRLLERHDDQVGGNERRLLGARDPDRRGQHRRLERAAGERHEHPASRARARRGRGAAGADAPGPPRRARPRRPRRRRAQRHRSRSSRSARSATTRMSSPGARGRAPRRASRAGSRVRRDSSGVPTKT